MDIFVDKNELVAVLNSKKIPNEINLSLWEDEFYIWVAICLVYGNKIGEQEYVQINKVNKNDYYDNLEKYKKETYKIKRLIKKEFSLVKVSSCFQWK